MRGGMNELKAHMVSAQLLTCLPNVALRIKTKAKQNKTFFLDSDY